MIAKGVSEACGMNILAFDTCFESCSVAVAVDAGTAGMRCWTRFERMQTGQAERLVPMIGEVMTEAGIAFTDLDRIAVTVGPGTFTGARIGIAAARALALSLDVPVVSFTSFEVMSRDPNLNITPEEHLLIAADARRGEVYVHDAGAERSAEREQPQLLAIADAAKLGGTETLVIAGTGGELVATAAKALGRAARAILPGLQPRMENVMAAAVKRDPSGLPPRPLYLRPPDAKPQAGKTLVRAP